MKKQFLALSTIGLVTIITCGCSNPSLSRAAATAYQKNSQQAEQSISQLTKKGCFNVNKGRFVDTNAHVIHPKWEYKHVEMHAFQQPLVEIMNRISKGSGVEFTYNDNLSHQLVNINYNGNLIGAIKHIMQKNNIYFTIESDNQNNVNWSRLETKTFNIAYLPGSTSFSMGGSESSNSSGGGTGGAPSNTGKNTLSGKVDVWSDMEKTISKMLSKAGRYDINQSDSSITVIDSPLIVQRISSYLKKYNKSLSERVAIKVKIIEVRLNKSHQFGIDWNLIYKGLSLGGLTGNALSDIPGYAMNTGSNNSGSSDKPSTGGLGSNWAISGSSAFVNAFDEQGKTSVVNEPTITSLNNSPSTISVTDKKAYIKSTSVSENSSGADGNTLTYTVTPDDVTTGLKLTLIPHIKNNQVFMSINGSLSDLINMESRSWGYKNGNNNIHVDLPETASKEFNQQVMVKNHHIIVMSGLKTKINNDKGTKNFYLSPLGQRQELSDQKELVVLIQPTILR